MIHSNLSAILTHQDSELALIKSAPESSLKGTIIAGPVYRATGHSRKLGGFPMNSRLKIQLNRCHADFLRANPRRKLTWHEKQITVTLISTARESRLTASLLNQARFWFPSGKGLSGNDTF